MAKIAIIDYGMGNLRSVEKAFHFVGATKAFVTSDPRDIALADKAVLPGDGAFDSTMDNLVATGIDEVVRAFVASGRPFLGICIGMQVLMTSSDEGRQGVAGLNLIPGKVKRFPSTIPGLTTKLPVPLIGWNKLKVGSTSKLLKGLERRDEAVYFLHSYYCSPENEQDIAGTSEYGVTYCASIERDNLYATQFHPEKSGDAGLLILQNFAGI